MSRVYTLKTRQKRIIFGQPWIAVSNILKKSSLIEFPWATESSIIIINQQQSHRDFTGLING